MITVPDLYFTKGCGRCQRYDTPECRAIFWHEGLAELRRICLDEGLTETAKWGHPVYMREDRNIAILGAFRDYFQLSFMNASLLKDPEKILEKQGPNAQYASRVRFDHAGQVLDREPTLRAYLQEAMGYAKAGIRPKKEPREVEWPEELIEALDADPELAEAFYALTPGRQKSYAFNLNQAKKSETRLARIEKFRPKIFAGKGALDP